MQRILRKYLSLASRPSPSPLAALPEMPDCRSDPVIGTVAAILDPERGRRLHEYIDKRHRKCGPLFRDKIGPTKAIFVSSSEAIREVFRIEGPTPQHFVPEAWLLYNQMQNKKRGLLFM